MQKIPFCPCRTQHGLGINSHLVKDDGKLVHKRDIDVALAVLNDFRSLRNLNALGAMDARFHDEAVDLRDVFERFRIHARDDLHDAFESMFLVARIDALG